MMSDDVSDDDSMTALMTRWTAMEIVLNLEKVTRTMQKTLCRMIIAAMEQTLLSIVFIGKEKTKWGNVKIKQMAKYFEKNYLVLFAKPRKPLRPSKRATV